MSTAEALHLRVAEDITQLVGETPMLHMRRLTPPDAADIYAKLEYLNPGGSIKDRAAIGMIREETTAQEIFDQMRGAIDAIVIGIGTGGTFSGVAHFLKKRIPHLWAVAVETEGSVLQGGPAGPHKVEGIGVSFIPKTFDPKMADEIIKVSDADAFNMVK